MKNKVLLYYSKKELISLIEVYSKEWLAMDGVWFQSVEKEFGIDKAMEHNKNIWKQFTVIEAKNIKRWLDLPENSGIDGLEKALKLRIYANINADEIIIENNVLIYRTLECRVQSARKRKGIRFHPCKDVGIVEYTEFAKIIDERFTCEVISCYPDITDSTCSCSWKFLLHE